MIYKKKEAQTSAPITLFGFSIYLYITRNQSPVHTPSRLVCHFLMLNTFDVICDLFLKQTQDSMESICCLTNKITILFLFVETDSLLQRSMHEQCNLCGNFQLPRKRLSLQYMSTILRRQRLQYLLLRVFHLHSFLFYSFPIFSLCFLLLLLSQSPGRSCSKHG